MILTIYIGIYEKVCELIWVFNKYQKNSQKHPNLTFNEPFEN